MDSSNNKLKIPNHLHPRVNVINAIHTLTEQLDKQSQIIEQQQKQIDRLNKLVEQQAQSIATNAMLLSRFNYEI
jgi:DNA-binding protein H-NS